MVINPRKIRGAERLVVINPRKRRGAERMVVINPCKIRGAERLVVINPCKIRGAERLVVIQLLRRSRHRAWLRCGAGFEIAWGMVSKHPADLQNVGFPALQFVFHPCLASS